jgi:hypothetical protein
MGAALLLLQFATPKLCGTLQAKVMLSVEIMLGYTSMEFQRVREALLACNDADRAYLRRWILRWIDDYGRISREAEKLPDKGCK